MAASMTYNQLVADIQSYAERSDADFVAQVPRFIMLAENRIASEVHGLGYLRYAESAMSAGESVIEKPARWRETASLAITLPSGSLKFLHQRPYTFCRSFWPDKTSTAEPEFYCDYGYERLLITATPDLDYAFELAYHERPIPLDSTNQVNWTTQYAPQLLLFASLIEAQPWLKMPERTQEFQALFDRAAAAVTAEARRRMLGDQSLLKSEG